MSAVNAAWLAVRAARRCRAAAVIGRALAGSLLLFVLLSSSVAATDQHPQWLRAASAAKVNARQCIDRATAYYPIQVPWDLLPISFQPKMNYLGSGVGQTTLKKLT